MKQISFLTLLPGAMFAMPLMVQGAEAVAVDVTLKTSVGNSETINLKIGVGGATPETPKTVSVDFGNGEFKNFEIVTSGIPESSNVTGSVTSANPDIRVSVGDGQTLTALGTEGLALNSVDLYKAAGLTALSLPGAGLGYVGLYNKAHLEFLDLSGNDLMYFDSDGLGALKTLNLSGNPQLEKLYLYGVPDLEHLDISNCNFTKIDVALGESIKYFDCSDNYLTFVTLPVVKDATYIYAPQAQVTISGKGVAAHLDNLVADAADEPTKAKWFSSTLDKALEEGAGYDYYGDGTFVFPDVSVGEVFCELTNAAFPDLTLRTSSMEVLEMPEYERASLHTGNAVDFGLLHLQTTDCQPVYINWSGKPLDLVEYTPCDYPYSIYDVTTYDDMEVKIYTYSPDVEIVRFGLQSVHLNRIDVSKLTKLYNFTLASTGSPEILYPENPDLEELVVVESGLSSVPVEKYPLLAVLNVSNNNLESLDVTGLPKLEYVGITNNRIINLPLNNPLMTMLHVGNNGMETLDLSGVSNLKQLKAGNNKLKTIDVSGLADLSSLDLDGNCFNFATLPPFLDSYYDYSYYDQMPMAVQADGLKVDLSSQNGIGGYATTYNWFKATGVDAAGYPTGDPLTQGVDYELENGVTTFKDASLGTVACKMNNESFPWLDIYTEAINLANGSVEQIYNSLPVEITCRDGIIEVSADSVQEVSVYSVSGSLVGNAHGTSRFAVGERGVYIVRVGSHTEKVMVR